MPKYYVQSGTLQVITTASDPRGAAIWAVHRALSHSLPFVSDDPRCFAPPAMPQRLDEAILVSEQGFDHDDNYRFETLEIVGEWNSLLLAIERIEQRFAMAEVAC
jgi:hypothetical protein